MRGKEVDGERGRRGLRKKVEGRRKGARRGEGERGLMQQIMFKYQEQMRVHLFYNI